MSDERNKFDEIEESCIKKFANSSLGKWHERNDVGLGVAAAVSCVNPSLPVILVAGVAAQAAFELYSDYVENEEG